MTKIAQSLTELVGNTPLLRLNRFEKNRRSFGMILAKLECFNPLSSVKDRVGLGMVEAAEREGRIAADTVIIEPTSGNTGVALAFVAASRGYRIILTMPENMSVERRKLLKMLGAELVLTPASEGMRGAIDKAEELAGKIPNAFIPMQFDNPHNPETHYNTTARELYDQTDGKIDLFVAGIGTGGTFTGVTRFLKEKNPGLLAYAVEPADSPLLSGGKAGSHKIQGIGANFVPSVLERNLIDGVMPVSSEAAFATAREVAKCEGLLVGISSGAALAAAAELAARPENAGKTIVAVLPDTGERYLSTELFDECGIGGESNVLL